MRAKTWGSDDAGPIVQMIFVAILRVGNFNLTPGLSSSYVVGRAIKALIWLIQYGIYAGPALCGNGISRRNVWIALVTFSGCSSVEMCAAFGTMTSFEPTILLAILFASSTVVSSSFSPTIIKVGTRISSSNGVESDRSARPLRPPMIPIGLIASIVLRASLTIDALVSTLCLLNSLGNIRSAKLATPFLTTRPAISIRPNLALG